MHLQLRPQPPLLQLLPPEEALQQSQLRYQLTSSRKLRPAHILEIEGATSTTVPADARLATVASSSISVFNAGLATPWSAITEGRIPLSRCSLRSVNPRLKIGESQG